MTPDAAAIAATSETILAMREEGRRRVLRYWERVALHQIEFGPGNDAAYIHAMIRRLRASGDKDAVDASLHIRRLREICIFQQRSLNLAMEALHKIADGFGLDAATAWGIAHAAIHRPR